jgi:hypothetical protein
MTIYFADKPPLDLVMPDESLPDWYSGLQALLLWHRQPAPEQQFFVRHSAASNANAVRVESVKHANEHRRPVIIEARLHQTRVVCITGPIASGKSTQATLTAKRRNWPLIQLSNGMFFVDGDKVCEKPGDDCAAGEAIAEWVAGNDLRYAKNRKAASQDPALPLAALPCVLMDEGILQSAEMLSSFCDYRGGMRVDLCICLGALMGVDKPVDTPGVSPLEQSLKDAKAWQTATDIIDDLPDSTLIEEFEDSTACAEDVNVMIDVVLDEWLASDDHTSPEVMKAESCKKKLVHKRSAVAEQASCSSCGESVVSGTRFCAKCGTAVLVARVAGSNLWEPSSLRSHFYNAADDAARNPQLVIPVPEFGSVNTRVMTVGALLWQKAAIRLMEIAKRKGKCWASALADVVRTASPAEAKRYPRTKLRAAAGFIRTPVHRAPPPVRPPPRVPVDASDPNEPTAPLLQEHVGRIPTPAVVKVAPKQNKSQSDAWGMQEKVTSLSVWGFDASAATGAAPLSERREAWLRPEDALGALRAVFLKMDQQLVRQAVQDWLSFVVFSAWQEAGVVDDNSLRR